jgi:hypothetical protein
VRRHCCDFLLRWSNCALPLSRFAVTMKPPEGRLCQSITFILKIPPYTLAGFDLMTHSFSLLVAGGDGTTILSRQG